MTRLAFSAACAALFAFSAPVSGEEPDQESVRLFESLDSNQDQQVAPEEVGERQGLFERLLRVGDSNTDGQLGREEFVLALLAEGDQPAAVEQADERADRPDPRRRGGPMFDRLDRNQDGKVTRDEIPEQAPEQVRERLNRLFERSGGDALTRKDFQRSVNDFQRDAPAGRTPLGEEVYKRWDRNGDGQLNRDEVPEFARPRMNRLFDHLGKDTVSFEDLSRAAEQRGERREEGRGEARPERRERAEGSPDGTRRLDDQRRAEQDRRPPQGGRGADRPGPGDRAGFGPGRSGERFGGPAILRLLDTDRDGQLSRRELARLSDRFSQLDRNHNDRLDLGELMGPGDFDGRRGPWNASARFEGPPRGAGPRGFGNRPGRPAADRPDGPLEGASRERDADRPQRDEAKSDRPDGDRPDGDRPRPPRDRQPGDGESGKSDREPSSDERQASRESRPWSARARFASEDRPRDPERRGPMFASRSRAPSFLARLDRDGDGAISRDEATEQIREKFERLDADSDGKLTFEEFHRAILREYGLDQRPE